MAVTVNGVPHDPGCYVDGHWGQYGASRVIGIADGALDTNYWEEAIKEARIGYQRDAADMARMARDVTATAEWRVQWQRMAAVTYEESRDPYGIMVDELSGCEVVSEIADEAEEALNAATVGGFWSWEDGEFFLTETAGECPECGGTLAVGPDGTACLDEMCVSNSMMYGGRDA